jgi:hypothetical protein
MVDLITPDEKKRMNNLAEHLDWIFNGLERPRKIGFVLLTYKLGENIEGTGHVNYIGNSERQDVLLALKELIARWEGRYMGTDTKQ